MKLNSFDFLHEGAVAGSTDWVEISSTDVYINSAFNSAHVNDVSISGSLHGAYHCSLKCGSRAADNLDSGQDLNCVSRFFTDFFKAVTRPVISGMAIIRCSLKGTVHPQKIFLHM